MEALVTGITSTLPGCALQFNFIPAFNEVPYVERLLEKAPSRCGYLIAVKSPQLQRLFERQPAPSVLLGTPFQGITKLAWVDKNQSAIGHLLASKLIEQGHRRIGVILRDRRGCGDDLMMDAITEEIINAGLGSGGLVVRSVPAEAALISMAVHALLEPETRPSAVICRNRAIFTSVVTACNALGISVPSELALALADPPSDPEETTLLPCLRPKSGIDAETEGRQLAEILLSLSRREPAQKLHQQIQVSL
jgi:DNA-binding LacI/PurR family transcriptional regulator